MRKFLNTLFVLTEDAYLTLDGENVVLRNGDEKIRRLPLHTIENIMCFSYKGASPALMGACVTRNIGICFLSPNGRFLARICGESHGNVLLRKEQYRVSDDEKASNLIAKNFIIGKIYNGKWSLERTIREYPLRVNIDKLKKVSHVMAHTLPNIMASTDSNSLRGLEGESAAQYFSVFDDLILNQKEDFSFHGRSRRPPLDNINALLSFAYTLLAHDCASALEGVGLDSYVGFMHRDRAGRTSLALDLMEELRPILADRFVITLINNRIIRPKHCERQESGAILLTDDGRKAFLEAWYGKKLEEITHPYLKEKMKWGLVPFAQALLLARHLRGDLDEYPPFLWK